MTHSQSLQELLSRVEVATGPDRELDAMIVQATTPELHDAFADRVGFVVGGNHEQPTKAPELTASVDAALGLVERLLPDMDWSLDKDTGRFLVRISTSRKITQPRIAVHSEAVTAPLAILAALLRARIAKETDHG